MELDRAVVKAAAKLMKFSQTGARQRWSEILLKQLCRAAGIAPAKVKISDTRQYHKKYRGVTVFKQYGYYRPASGYIYIQNLTPAFGRPLAAKTFLDSLLHEWLHHYDHHKLKLNSIHSKGFYLRLKSLKAKLEIL